MYLITHQNFMRFASKYYIFEYNFDKNFHHSVFDFSSDFGLHREIKTDTRDCHSASHPVSCRYRAHLFDQLCFRHVCVVCCFVYDLDLNFGPTRNFWNRNFQVENISGLRIFSEKTRKTTVYNFWWQIMMSYHHLWHFGMYRGSTTNPDFFFWRK